MNDYSVTVGYHLLQMTHDQNLSSVGHFYRWILFHSIFFKSWGRYRKPFKVWSVGNDL